MAGYKLKPLPPSTNAEVSMAVTLIGGVLGNVLLYHLAHFPEGERVNRADQAFHVIRTAILPHASSAGSPEERANVQRLVAALIDDVEGMVNFNLDRPPTGDSSVH